MFRKLDKNPLLTSKPLCKLLNLRYKDYGRYIANLRCHWKYHHENEQGSKCSSVHGWRGWCFVPLGIGREQAAKLGWVLSKARNRWLLWKDRLGRLQWFETGRVNVYVRSPATLGKAYQLVCNGFSFTGLVTDMKVLEKVLGSIKFKSAHFVFPTKQRLPKLTIDLFKKSNGLIIKVGDSTHPHSVEVIASYMDWAERNEDLYIKLLNLLSSNSSSLPELKDDDYIR